MVLGPMIVRSCVVDKCQLCVDLIQDYACWLQLAAFCAELAVLYRRRCNRIVVPLVYIVLIAFATSGKYSYIFRTSSMRFVFKSTQILRDAVTADCIVQNSVDILRWIDPQMKHMG